MKLFLLCLPPPIREYWTRQSSEANPEITSSNNFSVVAKKAQDSMNFLMATSLEDIPASIFSNGSKTDRQAGIGFSCPGLLNCP